MQANLAHCGFGREATVERNDSFTFLERYRGEPFDFIFVAPPQYQDLWRKALQMIDERPSLTAEYATIVVQIHPVEDKPVELQRLQEYDRRKYGSVMLLFYADAADLDEKGAEHRSRRGSGTGRGRRIKEKRRHRLGGASYLLHVTARVRAKDYSATGKYTTWPCWASCGTLTVTLSAPVSVWPAGSVTANVYWPAASLSTAMPPSVEL